jgi:hypothetical protein
VTVIDWPLDSDTSIRWQVLRDITDAPVDVVAAERARVAVEDAQQNAGRDRRRPGPAQPLEHVTRLARAPLVEHASS